MIIPYTKESYQLLHQGTLALAEVEANGIRADVDYLDKTIVKSKRKMESIKQELSEMKVAKLWKKTYGSKMNFNSIEQLGKILFEKMKFPVSAYTPSGKYKTDEKTLASVDIPFVKKYMQLRKMGKALSTYLIGIRHEVVDGFIHPFFSLNKVRSFRSSSEAPNFQNFPMRDKEVMTLVRSAFIPRNKNRRLVELDYGGIEVKVAYCYHLDPTMKTYLMNPEKDMHRDMAMQIYCLKKEQITKETRYSAKNGFVFPQFYGDWWLSCARALWENIDTLHLKTAKGTPLKDWLKKQGITELGDPDPREEPRQGTFNRHLKDIEKDFWYKRFPVYTQWKKTWHQEYLAKGWMQMKTGFIVQGYLERNGIINYPIQGAAFHCLLWALIRLTKELKKRKMKTLIVGQIHDSIVADVPDEETADFIGLAQDIMKRQLREHWDWIIIPMEVEAEVGPPGGSWNLKTEWKG